MRSVAWILSGLIVVAAAGVRAEPPKDADYDLVIKGGRIVDGTGKAAFVGDVAVREGRIAAVGDLGDAPAREVIDAKGLIVAPGFVDMMGQTASPMLEDPETALNLLTQGITTINAGEGDSAAPLGDAAAGRMGWRTMAEYFQLLEQRGLPVNVTQTVGLTQVREIVLGDTDRRPSDEELAQMQALVREGMEAGAIGISTALIYPPAVFATTRELTALAQTAAEHGGRYYTHMRNEGDRLLEAIDEAIEIGTKSGAGVHIFHLKAAGRQNWEKMPLAIARIKAARAGGLRIAADVYPYDINGLGLEALIHPRHFAGGRERLLGALKGAELRSEIRRELESTSGWENWYRHVDQDWNRIIIGATSDARYAKHAGKSVAEIATAVGEDPWDTFFNLVQAGSFALPQSMSEANVAAAMGEDFVSFCTDVGPAWGASSASHPRSHGAFPRLFARFVRELGALSLEEAVAQASAVGADEVMAKDRGRLTEGLAADIIVFDFDAFRDRATAAEPRLASEGMKHVLVNGVPVLRDGQPTTRRPGRVLRGPGYKPETAPHAQMTGRAAPGLEAIDKAMQDLLAKQRATGASVAITDQGRLVYARGFGYGDVAAKELVQAESLFRIASVSKPITAVAIFQLIDAGKLRLDDKVFDILTEFEPHLEKDAKFDERQRAITIRHLLEHRGGWDRDASFDAMFQSIRFADAVGEPAPASHQAIIRCMLGLPLDFEPGAKYAYSNYGYCLLGRVIEKLTGQGYEAYVQEHVLRPVGAVQTQLGATLLAGRSPGEVRYYDSLAGTSVYAATRGERVPSAYGAWPLESLDSHGGWVSSSVELVRFASAFDNPAKSPLLSEQAIAAMFAPPAGLEGNNDPNGARDFYASGWQVVRPAGDGVTLQMHSGSLPGTNTMLVRRSDGRNFAVLFNARETPHTEGLSTAAAAEINRVLDGIKGLPGVDYFEEVREHGG